MTEASLDGRLKKEDVKHLALEGGGGKGFAFVGALEVLEEPLGILAYESVQPSPYLKAYLPEWMKPVAGKIDQNRRLSGQVKGVSGASAGAITAFMLSCGYSPAEITVMMDSYDFDLFFEAPTPRMVPTLSLDYTSSDPTGAEVRLPERSRAAEDSTALKHSAYKALLIALAPALGVPWTAADLTKAAIDAAWRRILDVAPELLRLYRTLTGASGLHAVQMLLDHLPQYLAFLPEDMGLFPGFQSRRFLAEALAAKFPSYSGTPNFNASFRAHYNYFGVKLAVTGTNLETGKSEVFSNDTTPFFPVVDAVRISMGLPLVFKPLVIRKDELRQMLPDWVAGVWVDGGYLNNLPMAAFDSDRDADGKPTTLGLRLEEDKRTDIRNFWDMLAVWPVGMGIMGVGESGVTASWGQTARTINLPTPGLSLLNFSPSKQDRAEAIKLAKQKTLEYFGAKVIEFGEGSTIELIEFEDGSTVVAR